MCGSVSQARFDHDYRTTQICRTEPHFPLKQFTLVLAERTSLYDILHLGFSFPPTDLSSAKFNSLLLPRRRPVCACAPASTDVFIIYGMNDCHEKNTHDMFPFFFYYYQQSHSRRQQLAGATWSQTVFQ